MPRRKGTKPEADQEGGGKPWEVRALVDFLSYSKTKMTDEAKLLFLVLDGHARMETYCFPGNGYLEAETGKKERAIRVILNQLIDGGWIERFRKKGKKGTRLGFVLLRRVNPYVYPAATTPEEIARAMAALQAQANTEDCVPDAASSRQKNAAELPRPTGVVKQANNPSVAPPGGGSASVKQDGTAGRPAEADASLRPAIAGSSLRSAGGAAVPEKIKGEIAAGIIAKATTILAEGGNEDDVAEAIYNTSQVQAWVKQLWPAAREDNDDPIWGYKGLIEQTLATVSTRVRLGFIPIRQADQEIEVASLAPVVARAGRLFPGDPGIGARVGTLAKDYAADWIVCAIEAAERKAETGATVTWGYVVVALKNIAAEGGPPAKAVNPAEARRALRKLIDNISYCKQAIETAEYVMFHLRTAETHPDSQRGKLVLRENPAPITERIASQEKYIERCKANAIQARADLRAASPEEMDKIERTEQVLREMGIQSGWENKAAASAPATSPSSSPPS